MDRQPVPYVPIRPVPLAKVHVPYIGILGAGYFEDVFSPAAFSAAEGVSVYSVGNILRVTGNRIRSGVASLARIEV